MGKLEEIKRQLISSGIKIYHEEDAGIIINDDCLNILPKIPDKSIDLVLTDPPYGTGGRDGSTHLMDRNIGGNRMSIDSYIWMVKQYSSELYRVSKDNSHCYIFSDWRRYKNIQIAFEISGWELRSLIVWDKGNGMGEYWRSCHEFILFFTKIKPRRLNHGKCYNVLRFPSVKGKQHPAEKPIDLIRFLIEASSSPKDIIIDCFAGTGPVGMTSKKYDRRAIEIEIEEKYCDIAVQRLSQEVLTL